MYIYQNCSSTETNPKGGRDSQCYFQGIQHLSALHALHKGSVSLLLSLNVQLQACAKFPSQSQRFKSVCAKPKGQAIELSCTQF